ncbi:hypothetical protein PROFUN_06101 [Planoprotostelium fungivorum]|uniref:NOL1/NOP2/Sun domain family member 4 n=1 Tax=Planoprotostelium fungivorum TaxID=1890364 RepID=A0A2P6NPV2_9EUKA|nr:hypothetical protein PROFUN_06101 [Planoprotostelium fungivorum]
MLINRVALLYNTTHAPIPVTHRCRWYTTAVDGQTTKKNKPLSKNKEKALAKERLQLEKATNAFNTLYTDMYGAERYSNEEQMNTTVKRLQKLEKVEHINTLAYTSSERFPQPPKDHRGLSIYYPLDAASLLVVDALRLEPDHQVLDMCAAPGGKTVGIMQHLSNPSASLTSNEISPDRLRRLKQVLRDYLGDEYRQRVTVTRRDAMHWREEEKYHRVLLDAPCSAERHLLRDADELSKWTPKRTSTLYKEQVVMLKSALRAVRVGGLVVYSTCSISNKENDAVIERVLDKSKVIKKEWKVGEQTTHGWAVLPDRSDGWGPMYFSVLERLPDDPSQ